MSAQSQRQRYRYRIGYALTPKKEQTFIQSSLLTKATERGIDFLRIDPNKPLIEQGPFHCIIHKLYGPDWKHQLQQFSSQNSSVPIIDSPQSIERLLNRISMLEVVTQLKLDSENEIAVPNQLVVSEILSSTSGEAMKLRFPLIAKPLVADGGVNSHHLFLIFDHEGLENLKTPIVLQEFVNHGGVVFKVYVAGFSVKCVKRRSLPDISEEKLKSLNGFLPFSQISNFVDRGKQDDDEVNLESVEMPSESFVLGLAKAMREALGLNLFNFDVIRDARDCKRYLVIDINYFPGYAKMPEYESILTDFFLQVMNKKIVEGATGGDA